MDHLKYLKTRQIQFPPIKKESLELIINSLQTDDYSEINKKIQYLSELVSLKTEEYFYKTDENQMLNYLFFREKLKIDNNKNNGN